MWLRNRMIGMVLVDEFNARGTMINAIMKVKIKLID